MLAAVMLMAASCHPRTKVLLVPADERSARVAFAELWRGVRSIRAEGGFTLSVDGDVYPGKLALVMRKPELVRADFFDYFGSLKGLLILAGEHVVRILPGEGASSGNPPEVALLERLAASGGDAPNEELAALMVGVPAGFAGRLPITSVEGARGERQAGGISLIGFLGRPVLEEVALRDPATGETVILAYDGYEMNGDLPLPRRVIVDAPTRKWHLEITWKQVDLNVDIERGLFETALPD